MSPEMVFGIIVKGYYCGECPWDYEDNECVECDCYRMVKFIESALEKRIPKKPHYYKDSPHCKCGYVITAGDDFCRKCGQMIDWSE